MVRAMMKLKDAPVGKVFTSEYADIPQATVDDLLAQMVERLPPQQRNRAWLAVLEVSLRIEAETATPLVLPPPDNGVRRAKASDRQRSGSCLYWNTALQAWLGVEWNMISAGAWVREQPPPPGGGS